MSKLLTSNKCCEFNSKLLLMFFLFCFFIVARNDKSYGWPTTSRSPKTTASFLRFPPFPASAQILHCKECPIHSEWEHVYYEKVIFLSRVFLYKKSKISKRTKRTEPFTIYAKRMEAATNEIMFSALHKIGQHKTSLPTVRELIFFSPPLDEYLSV